MSLETHLKELIAAEGPISIARYMELCLGHPTLGYYTTRDPFGAEGDFVTAPEISQIFGELIGIWVASLWNGMGRPASLRLVEIGPGRGTLMADLLRAARAMPGLGEALSVHLVETSPVLHRRQELTLAGYGVTWHARIETALSGPVVVVANELLDALPIRQLVVGADGLHERLVGLDDKGALRFGLSPEVVAPRPGGLEDGAVLAWPEAADALVARVAKQLAQAGGAALLIDYGSATGGSGDTLQAVSRHRFVDPLESPGECDLTVQVDFARAARIARATGAASHGPVTQAGFLAAMGLAERAEVLRRKATPEQAAALDAAIARLTDRSERGMGALFKVLGLAHGALPLLPGFDRMQPPGLQGN